MSHQTEYDLRMRSYKSITDAHLIPRTPVIIQIDGRAFHTFTRGFKKPFDQVLMAAMRYTAEYLCRNIQGCVLAYTQSDEINLLLIDYEKLETSPWFDNRVQKLASIAASMATLVFNDFFKKGITKENSTFTDEWLDNGDFNPKYKDEELNKLWITHKRASEKGAEFAACAFNLPREEVTNYFNWRQQDAIRNSIQMVGQAHFSQTELNGKCNQEIIEMLIQQRDIDWNKLEIYKQRGTCIIRSAHSSFLLNGKQITTDTWSYDFDIPRFIGEGRDYIERYLYPDDPNNTISRKDGNN